LTNSYTEVATGLNYLTASNQWAAASDEIDLVGSGGAEAVRGQHKVFFPPDICDGKIVLTMPDGFRCL
jgi:hypothetical protein